MFFSIIAPITFPDVPAQFRTCSQPLVFPRAFLTFLFCAAATALCAAATALCAVPSAVSTSPSDAPAAPVPAPAQLLNVSTRLRAQTGDNVLIGGFIITGNEPKAVVLRGLGPSLTSFGISGVLLDPVLQLRGNSGNVILQNDNWKDTQRNQIEGTPFQPTDDRESVIITTLPPTSYTVILTGKNGTTGICAVEVYDYNQGADSKLGNLSTRGFVQTQDKVMIAGLTLGLSNGQTAIAIRGLGPSLSQAGISNVLADPTLELHDSNGTTVTCNDDWLSDPVSAAELTARGLAPSDPKESGIFISLPPGSFTAILAGKNGGVGVGLVEIYDGGPGNGAPPPPPSCPPAPTPTATPTATPAATATATSTPTATPTATATATPTAPSCTQNFDGVMAPALPEGWVPTNAAGPEPSWLTSSAISDTSPNNAVVKGPSEISDKRLDSPDIAIFSASAQLRFRNNFSLQQSFDGGVLEISINGGAFTDILAAGGSFVTGGYTNTISPGSASPIAGRSAWSGNSGGYIDGVVNLGPNVVGQTIKLRFRLGTDQATGSGGWRIDTISIPGGTCP